MRRSSLQKVQPKRSLRSSCKIRQRQSPWCACRLLAAANRGTENAVTACCRPIGSLAPEGIGVIGSMGRPDNNRCPLWSLRPSASSTETKPQEAGLLQPTLFPRARDVAVEAVADDRWIDVWYTLRVTRAARLWSTRSWSGGSSLEQRTRLASMLRIFDGGDKVIVKGTVEQVTSALLGRPEGL
jgi:hypothetical protein